MVLWVSTSSRLESAMKQVIIELDDLLALESEHVARQNGKSLSEAVAEALQTYIDTNRKPTHLSFIGIGEGDGRPYTAEDLDQELRDGLDPIEGWSPDRRGLLPESRRAAGD